jgi:acyl-homoserine lactone acylase PvdQ
MGVAFPSVPVVDIGTNGYVAWGFTNTGADVIDYYYYVWNGTRCYYNGSWLEAKRRVEVFKICDLDNILVQYYTRPWVGPPQLNYRQVEAGGLVYGKRRAWLPSLSGT